MMGCNFLSYPWSSSQVFHFPKYPPPSSVPDHSRDSVNFCWLSEQINATVPVYYLFLVLSKVCLLENNNHLCPRVYFLFKNLGGTFQVLSFLCTHTPHSLLSVQPSLPFLCECTDTQGQGVSNAAGVQQWEWKRLKWWREQVTERTALSVFWESHTTESNILEGDLHNAAGNSQDSSLELNIVWLHFLCVCVCVCVWCDIHLQLYCACYSSKKQNIVFD